MTLRLMRGQVIVREIFPENKFGLWTPEPSHPRAIKTHRGIVLGMGLPAEVSFYRSDLGKVVSYEVPFGFRVGDTVQYHFEHHQEAWTTPWPDDGKPATWLPQHCVDAVI